ncbi:MAG: matrixin family metalloprotease [Bacteriovoracaceae bacterium]|nr:matrixin family metalloprotease [Bacteriovoracaceae bacterium]
MKYLLLFFIPSLSFAFTLNNSIGARYKKDKVSVRVASNTNCTTAGTTIDELEGFIQPAIKDFWNTVPTSRLILEDGGTYESSDNLFNTGELCLNAGCASAVPNVTDIVIACNTNATNFPGASSLLALTLPNVISGKDIKGSVVLINNTNGSFGALTKNQKIAVLSHEIGHAIGLGHSEKKEALMYYSVVPKRSALGQDDVDGVSYLYPVQGDIYGLGCFLNTIAIVNKNDDSDNEGGGPGPFWPTAFLGLILGLSLKKFKRST